MVFHKEDRLLKELAYFFGQHLFDYLEMLEKENNEKYTPMTCTKIKDIHSTELITANYTSQLMDFVYQMEDETFVHYEHFSSKLNENHIIRTGINDLNLYQKTKKLVNTVIISTGDPNKSVTNVKFSDNNIYIPKKIKFLKNYQGDKRLKNVKNKIKNNKELTPFDILDLILLPFLKTTKESEEVTKEICKLATKITNLTEEHSEILFWGLWLTTEIFIKNKNTQEKVRTMTLINKKSINEILHTKENKLMERGIKRGMKKGMKKGKEEIAGNMIKEGIPLTQISKITGLNINKIKQLKPGK